MSTKHSIMYLMFIIVASITVMASFLARQAPVDAECPDSSIESFDLGKASRSPIPTPVLTSEVLEVMAACHVKLSPPRQVAMARQVARVAAETFSKEQEAKSWFSLLCIESRYENSSVSSAGAIGLSQLMPNYSQHFSDACGLGKLEAGDIKDPELNLRLGACLFRDLLREFEGNTALALSGYNSGAGSGTTKKLAAGGNGVEETNGYLARHYVLSEKLKEVSSAKKSEK